MESHSAAAERKSSRSVWIIEESKAVQREILLPRHSAAGRFLYLSSTGGDAFFLFFHEKEKKEWGAENQRLKNVNNLQSLSLAALDSSLYTREPKVKCFLLFNIDRLF